MICIYTVQARIKDNTFLKKQAHVYIHSCTCKSVPVSKSSNPCYKATPQSQREREIEIEIERERERLGQGEEGEGTGQ